MGQPAAVQGDLITGTCAIHTVPNPGAGGAPMPSPAPMPFSAPLTMGLATRVLIGGRPAAVVGSSGTNVNPSHAPIHPGDPFRLPAAQIGAVVRGSSSVLIEGRPAAMTGASASVCGNVPAGQVNGTAATVLIGG